MAVVPACLDKPMTPYEQAGHQLIGQIRRSCESFTYWRKELGAERAKERTLREQVLTLHSESFAGAGRVAAAMKQMLDARKAVCADADGRRALGREGKSLDFAGSLGTRGEAMKVQALLRGRSDAREAPQRRSYSPRAGSGSPQRRSYSPRAGSGSPRPEPQAERQRRAERRAELDVAERAAANSLLSAERQAASRPRSPRCLARLRRAARAATSLTRIRWTR